MLKRVYDWLDDRLGISHAILPIIQHPVPREVNWWYVFGSATLVAFIVQVVTGVALAFTYVPAPNSAYDSLNFITHEALLGGVVRGIHFYGASAMIVLIVVHTCRVFLMGAYKYPREMSWLTGTLLLFCTLGMGFTGQLLRWDQDAYWAVVLSAEMVGRAPFVGDLLAQIIIAGQTVGGGTLTRFYASHVFLLPAVMFGLIGVHLYLVVRHGISEPPKAGVPVDPATYRERYNEEIHQRGVPFWPDAAWKDVVFALLVGSVVLALAVIIGPPLLGNQADPTNIQADPRPDWYFIWLFALLALMPPAIENVVMIGAPVLAIVVFLLLPFVAPTGERHPARRPWAVATVAFTLLSLAILIREGLLAPWSPEIGVGPLPASVTQGLSPLAATGAQVFQDKSCHACHSIAGSGGQRGPDLTTVGHRLSRDQIVSRILNGGGGIMPAYAGHMGPTDLEALVEFLATRRSP